jgi:hypothetical protein
MFRLGSLVANSLTDGIETLLADQGYLSGLPDDDFKKFLGSHFNAQNWSSVFNFVKDYVDVRSRILYTCFL